MNGDFQGGQEKDSQSTRELRFPVFKKSSEPSEPSSPESRIAQKIKDNEDPSWKDAISEIWNSTLRGVGGFSYNLRKNSGLADEKDYASFLEAKKNEYPDLYESYQNNLKANSRFPAGSSFYSLTPKEQFKVGEELETFRREGVKEGAVEVAGFKVPQEKAQKIKKTFLGGALTGLAESVPAMVLSAPTMGMSFFDMAYQGADEEIKRVEKEKGLELSQSDKETYKLAIAVPSMILERVGLSGVLKNTAISKRLASLAANRVIKRVVALGEGKVTAATFNKIAKEEAKGLKGFVERVGTGFLSEAETGGLQQLAADAVEQSMNMIKGKEIFDPKTAAEIAYDAIYAAGQEGIGGGIISTVVGGTSKPQMTPEEKKQVIEFVETLPDLEDVKDYIVENAKGGNIERGAAKRSYDTIKNYKEALSKIPDGLSEDNKVEALDLVLEKQKLQKQAEGLDSSIRERLIDPKIKAVEEQLVKVISNDIKTEEQVPSTEQAGEAAVEAQPDTEAGEAAVETGGAVQLDEETQGELDDVMRDADFTVSEQEAPTRASKTEAYADEGVQGGIINLIKTKGGELGREFVGAIERIKSTLGEGYRVVVLDDARYRDVTNTTGRGAFDTKNKVLYLNAQQVRNLDKDNVRAVYHEAIHPILTKRFGEASADFVRFKQDLVNAINRSLSGQDAATLIARLEAFEAQYGDKTTEQQAEEFMTELGAIMASEDVELLRKSGLLNRIKELINNLLRKLGADISLDTENDVVEFMNSLAQGVRGGVAAEQIVPEAKKADENNPSLKFSRNFTDPVFGYQFMYDENSERFKRYEDEGYIKNNVSITDFNGVEMVLHTPDGAFSGMILDKDGNLLVEGKGGMYYPIRFNEDGFFWASTKTAAEKLSASLNEMLEANDGKIYMGLVQSPVDKLLSSTTMANAVMDFFTSSVLNSKIKTFSQDKFHSALIKSAKKVVTTPKGKVGINKSGMQTILKKDGVAANLNKVNSLLGADNSSFADRKMFSEELINEAVKIINENSRTRNLFGQFFSEGIQNKYFKGTKKDGYNISKANVTQALSDMFSEPITKEFQGSALRSGIYAVLQIEGRVEPQPSDKHESYPMAIVSATGGRTTINILNKAVDWKKITIDPESGKPVSENESRARNILPTFGVSKYPVKIQVDESVMEEETPLSESRREDFDGVEGQKRGLVKEDYSFFSKIKERLNEQQKELNKQEPSEEELDAWGEELQLLRRKRKDINFLLDGLVRIPEKAYKEVENFLSDLNKPYLSKVLDLASIEAIYTGKKVYVGESLYRGDLIFEEGKEMSDEGVGKAYEVLGDGYVFRGVSLSDFERIKEQGFIDTDTRGAIVSSEGTNLARKPSTSFYYLPTIPYIGKDTEQDKVKGRRTAEEGVVMAIKVTPENRKSMFFIENDSYIRTRENIPFSDVHFFTTPSVEGRFTSVSTDAIGLATKPLTVKLNETLTKEQLEEIPKEFIQRLNKIQLKEREGVELSENDDVKVDYKISEEETPLSESRRDEETFLQESRAIINEQFLSEEKQVIKFRKAGVDNKQTQQAINDIGLKGVKFTKEGIEEAIQKAFDDLAARAESFVMTEDSKAITGAIMADIEAMRADGASESEVAYAERGLEEGSPVRGEYMRKFQDAQRNEIRNWVSYLNQSDYNTSFKYLILDGVLTNNYDKKRNKYVKRDRKTLRSVTPFNAASLAELYQSDSKEMLKDYTDIQEKNAIALAKSRQVATTTEGEWIKYDGGRDVSNEDIANNASELAGLVSDTPWCTKTNAASQLRDGDFYVYATKGEDGSMIPRIAIRMEGDQVSEVRGVASEKQDLEPSMNPVADKFLKENIPNDSGQKWLDSIEYNEKAEQLLQDINEKGLNRARMVSYFELLPDENKYTQDYGRNGHIERLEAKIEELVENNELASDLKGKVFIPNNALRIANRENLGNAEFVIGNLKLEPSDENIRLRRATGDSEFKVQYVSGDVRVIGDVTNIKFVGGNLGITDGNPISVEVVGGDVNAREATTLGNLRKVGGNLFAFNLKDLGNLEEVGDILNISGSDIKSLGNKIKSVNSLIASSPLEDFGSLEKVGNHISLRSDILLNIQPTENNIRFVENNRMAFDVAIEFSGITRHPKYREEAANKVYKARPSNFYIQYLKDKAGEAPLQESRNLAPNGQPSNLNDEQYKIVRTPEFKRWFGDWENDPENASKVVDENGEPLVVYHGSPAIDIESFDKSKSKKVSSGLKMFGTYFSTNPQLAEIYSSVSPSKEYESEIKDRIKELEDALYKVKNNISINAIKKEINRLEKVTYSVGRIYPVFLNMKDMVTFDAKGKQLSEGSWDELTFDVGYKIAKGNDALDVYRGVHPDFKDILKDGVKAENILESDISRELPKSLYESEKQRLIGDAFLVFDHVKNYAKLADGSNRTFDPEKEGLKESRNFDRKTEKAMEGVFYQPKIDERFNKASKRQMANKKLFDRQGIIRRALQDANDLITQAALSVRNGSSAAAKKMYERFNKNIFLNVAGKKKLGLNEIIMLRRIISIYDGFDRGIDTFQQEIKDLEAKKKRTKKETARLEAVKKQLADLEAKKANFKNPQKLNRESALARLDEIKQKMRDETGNDQQFFDMDNRASRFFAAMREILKRKLDEGLITQDEYFRLSKYEYSPRMFVDKVFDLQNGDFAKHEKRFMGYGLSEKEFKKLKEGSEEDLFTEGDFLLRMVVAASERRVFANRLFKQLGKKVGSYEWLSDTKKNGFSELTYKEDGESRSIYVRNDIAEEIENADKDVTEGLGKVGKYFGTNILRAMATGYNPLFPLSNIPMDFANVVMFTDTYDDKSLVRAMIELSKDFSKNLAGIGTITAAFRGTTKADPEVLKNLEEAFEAGIGMDFLTNQGRVKFKSVDGSKLERIGQTFGDFMSSFGENSELAMRLSVYNKVKADSLKKRKDGDAQFKDMNDAEIRAYAAFKARATIDFSQGGSLAKSLDKMSPYFNASLQGLRVAGNYIRTNPAKAAKKFGEAGLYAITMSVVMQQLFEMFGWDDDDKEAIPEYHRRNYFIIPTSDTDEDGNKKYIKIRKLPQLAPFLRLFELVGETTYRSMSGENEESNKALYTKGLVDLENTLKDATVFGDMIITFDKEGKPSLDVGVAQYLPPFMKGYIQYITNYDFFRERNISYEKLYNQASPEFEGKFDDNVEEFYKEFGELTGMSPKRTKNAVEVVTTSPSTNLMVGVGYGIANAIMTGDKSFKDVTRGMEKRAVGTANKKYIKRKPSAELNKLLQEYKDNQFVVRKELTKMVVEDNAPKKDVIQYVNGIDDKKLREYAIKKYKKLQRKNKFDDLVLDRKSVYYNLDDYMSEKPELAAEYLFNEFGSLTNPELREVASYISMIRGTRSFSYPPAFMRKYRELQK